MNNQGSFTTNSTHAAPINKQTKKKLNRLEGVISNLLTNNPDNALQFLIFRAIRPNQPGIQFWISTL